MGVSSSDGYEPSDPGEVSDVSARDFVILEDSSDDSEDEECDPFDVSLVGLKVMLRFKGHSESSKVIWSVQCLLIACRLSQRCSRLDIWMLPRRTWLPLTVTSSVKTNKYQLETYCNRWVWLCGRWGSGLLQYSVIVGISSKQSVSKERLEKSLSSSELSEFFSSLNEGVSHTKADVSGEADTSVGSAVYHFEGQEESGIYCTLPRQSRTKHMSPNPSALVSHELTYVCGTNIDSPFLSLLLSLSVSLFLFPLSVFLSISPLLFLYLTLPLSDDSTSRTQPLQ